jgi:hypothetical protein
MFHIKKISFCLVVLATLGLSACGGIPIKSIPRLLNLQNEVLNLNPRELKLAVKVDAQIVPPASSVPMLEISIKPAREGGFGPVSKRLPLQFESSSSPTGLSPAEKDRKWMVYALTVESQEELRLLQATIKKLMAERSSNGGGSMTVAMHQEGLAPEDPRLANTKWESWIQTDSKTGYFELWLGTLRDLKAAAKRANPAST